MTTYEPQPGTIPYRVIGWLRKHHPRGDKVCGAVICEELGITTDGFSTCMVRARAAGLVVAVSVPGEGKGLWWGVATQPGGEVESPIERDQPEAREHLRHRPVRPGPLFPGVSASAASEAFRTGFRALAWDGKVLVTGMEVRDGVAIFTREQIRALSAA